jgi:hypothetical protein
MIGLSYATNHQAVPEFAGDVAEPERKTVQKLFAAEKPKAVLQALELRRKASHPSVLLVRLNPFLPSAR